MASVGGEIEGAEPVNVSSENDVPTGLGASAVGELDDLEPPTFSVGAVAAALVASAVGEFDGFDTTDFPCDDGAAASSVAP